MLHNNFLTINTLCDLFCLRPTLIALTLLRKYLTQAPIFYCNDCVCVIAIDKLAYQSNAYFGDS